MVPERVLRHVTRIPGFRSLWLRFPIGSVATRVRYDVFDRPHYAYGVYSAADLAKSGDRIIPDRVRGIVSEWPGLTMVPRAGAPTEQQRANVPTEFAHLVKVDDE